MRKATVVIYVQMSEDDPFHIARPDAERAQLRTDFLITVDAKRNFPSDVGVKRLAGFEQMRSLARIDHDNAFWVIDDPSVRWEPFGPSPVGENGEPSSYSASAPFDLRALYSDGAGLDGV